jgi:phage protein D
MLRPTFVINGTESPVLSEGLLQLGVVDDGAGPARCEARFTNWGQVGRRTDFLYFNRRLLNFGAQFRVVLSDLTLFDGRIVAIDGGFGQNTPPTIGIRAEDRLIDLSMTRRSRTFEHVSDAEIASRIASDHGLTARVALPETTHAAVYQHNQTDLEFLRARLSAIDAELWVEGNQLHAQLRSERHHGTVILRQGAELLEFSVAADLREQRSRVVVAGWDVRKKSPIEASATDAVLGDEVRGRQSGAAILMASLGRRDEAIVDSVPLSSEEAQRHADASFKDRARRFVTGQGICVATPAMRPGTHLDLQGVGPLFSGQYYVTSVRHGFDPTNGTRTHFSAETPGLGPR